MCAFRRDFPDKLCEVPLTCLVSSVCRIKVFYKRWWTRTASGPPSRGRDPQRTLFSCLGLPFSLREWEWAGWFPLAGGHSDRLTSVLYLLVNILNISPGHRHILHNIDEWKILASFHRLPLPPCFTNDFKEMVENVTWTGDKVERLDSISSSSTG